MNPAETVVICPYNKAHSILRSRMQFHLTKCAAQYNFKEKVTCPFNATHVINKVELEVHQQICPNRINLDTFMYSVGEVSRPSGVLPVSNDIDVPLTEENWDENPVQTSVLDVVRNSAKEKGVLLNLVGAPRAERRAYRQQERRRYQEIVDGERLENALLWSETSPNNKIVIDGKNGFIQPSNRKIVQTKKAAKSQDLSQKGINLYRPEPPKQAQNTGTISKEEYKTEQEKPIKSSGAVPKEPKKNNEPEKQFTQRIGMKQLNEESTTQSNVDQIEHAIPSRQPAVTSSSSMASTEPKAIIKKPNSLVRTPWNLPAASSETEEIEGKMQNLAVGDFPELGTNTRRNRHPQGWQSDTSESDTTSSISQGNNAWSRPIRMDNNPWGRNSNSAPSLPPVSGRGRRMYSRDT